MSEIAQANRGWRSTATRCIALAVVATAVMEFHLWLGSFQLVVVLAGLVAILCINDGHEPLLGMRLAPVQGWAYWVRIAVWFALVVLALLVIFLNVWWLLDLPIALHTTRPEGFLWKLLHMCIYAPVSEEIVFRSLLTVAILPTVGERGTILISGVIFALIHILGGNPGPDNQIAGFMLQWAFLRSGTILVPIAMHSAGNLIAVANQIAAWYLLQ